MRSIAIILNIALFLLGIQMLVMERPWDIEELIRMIVIIICPMANMYILTHVQEEVSWLALLFKRKALEEKEKILEEQELILEEEELIIEEKEKIELEKKKLHDIQNSCDDLP